MKEWTPIQPWNFRAPKPPQWSDFVHEALVFLGCAAMMYYAVLMAGGAQW